MWLFSTLSNSPITVTNLVLLLCYVGFTSSSPIITVSDAKTLAINSLHCSNNSLSSQGLKLIFEIVEINVVADEAKQIMVTNSYIESSPFGLLSFGGFSDEVSPVTTP